MQSVVLRYSRPRRTSLSASLALSIFVAVAFVAFLGGFFTRKNPIMAFANFERQEPGVARPKEAA